MKAPGLVAVVAVFTAAVVAPLAAGAHITPPVVLMSDRDALIGLLSGARRFFVREVRLAAGERQAIQQQTGSVPDEDFYRFYLGRDLDGRLVAAAVFVTDYTVHGPVRVAVALGPDGRVTGLRVVEVTEETYAWVKPLIDHDLERAFVGKDRASGFTIDERVAGGRLDAMPQFYAQVIAGLVRRAAALFDVAIARPRS